VIRAWEKRYAAVVPGRSATQRRLYTDQDVERLVLLKRATEAGRTISEAARLGNAELAALLRTDEATGGTAPVSAIDGAKGLEQAHLERCLQAAVSAEPERLRVFLASAAAELGRPALIEGVLAPLMEAIGSRWEHGGMQIYEEHLATMVVRSMLDSLAQPDPRNSAGPVVVVATPSGQLHELGAMVAAAVANTAGWRVSYPGCNLPAAEIAACALRVGARAVALSISYPEGDAAVVAELRALRDLLPRETDLMVGGRAAASYRGAIDPAGVCWITDIRSLREELGRLARNS
jgi:methanogenic corrinoid protein MtbC1